MGAPLRIIHAADCHLDAPCRSLSGETRSAVDASARAGMDDLVSLAIDRHADALVIAGDLLDGDTVRVSTAMWLAETLERATAAGVTVIVTTGNHDPFATCAALHRVRWPAERFHLVGGATPVTIEVAGATIVAAGHEVAREQRNLVAGFPPAEPGVTTVGVVHAHVASTRSSHDRYAPCEAADLARVGYAYWALGHVHRAQPVAGERPASYSGAMQGRDFGETGAKGALVITIDPDGRVDTTHVPLARVRWEEVALRNALADVHAIHDLVALVEPAFRALQAAADARSDQQWVLRVRLSGPCPIRADLVAPQALDELADVLRERLEVLDVTVVDDGVTAAIDLAAYRDQDHVLGVALALLEESALDDEALEAIAPPSLAGAPTDPADRLAYVRGLLDGLDGAVATALLADGVR